jgi:hypothetical protein
MGRTVGIIIIVILVLFGLAWATGIIDFDQTQEGQLPDVSVDGGQLPKVDADVADVDVGTKNEVVEVPTIEVDRAE